MIKLLSCCIILAVSVEWAIGQSTSRIAFISARDGNAEIYTMAIDGTDVVRLTNDPTGAFEPSWSPDGRRIAFHSRREEIADIYLMDADGQNVTRLTHIVEMGRVNDNSNPSWSPDGSHIAFTSIPGYMTGANFIWVVNSDGTGPTQLLSSGMRDSDPSWSPDGSKIVFRAFAGTSEHPRPEIYVMNADGTQRVSLTPVSEGRDLDWSEAGDPVWSPDGKQIAFTMALRDQGVWDIGVMNADGSQLVNLTNTPDYELSPSWSPDGTQIAFSCSNGIGIMNRDGTGVRYIGEAGDGNPAWSPFLGGTTNVSPSSWGWVKYSEP